MDCTEELTLIERGLRDHQGVVSLEADFVGRRLHVEFDDQQTTAPAIAERIREIGFPAEVPLATVRTPLAKLPRMAPQTWIAGLLLVLALADLMKEGTSLLGWWLAAASAVVSLSPVGRAALRAMRLMAVDMNVLMTVAGLGALATGDSYEAATALFLFNLSLWIEQFSLGRARRAVETLIQYQAVVAHRLGDQGAQDVDPAEIAIGNRLLVKPGERIPVDGVVYEGRSTVNQAPVTGESVPVDKTAGDLVFAGTLNGDGVIVVEATQTAKQSTVARIAKLVEHAQATRSPTQRFVDQFARRYTPMVILLAIGVALLAPELFGSTWFDALHRGLVLLVIACPCALVISTPVTIVCGLHRAAARGMLIKGGEFLEAAGQIQTLAFDKTGTLTRGEPQIVSIRTIGELDDDELLAVAAAVESQSQHPLAAAIVAEARQQNITIPTATAVANHRGLGASGNVDGRAVLAGNGRWLDQEGIDRPPLSSMRSVAEAPRTEIWIAVDRRAVGVLELADTLRPDASTALDELRRAGVDHFVMLTGDRRPVAEAVARQLLIDDVRSELLPQDKLTALAELAPRYPHLAMVGDGINDAPALAAAPLGIALGAGASDTAIEAADVIILGPHLLRVAELIRLGQRCRQLLSQNVTLAIGIKLATLLAATAGWSNMWMAVAADVGASLVVIFNGMRMLNGRERGE